jgi:hypothetical protein
MLESRVFRAGLREKAVKELIKRKLVESEVGIGWKRISPIIELGCSKNLTLVTLNHLRGMMRIFKQSEPTIRLLEN